jgi:hypothetical protein
LINLQVFLFYVLQYILSTFNLTVCLNDWHYSFSCCLFNV